MSERRRKWWGWGYEEDGLDETTLASLRARLGRALGVDDFRELRPPPLESIELSPSRVRIPARLATFCTDAPLERISHAYGKAYVDVVRALRADFANAPDVVAYPSNEEQIAEVMAFCEAGRIALIPFGGGTSVVAGIEPPTRGPYTGAITLDMRRMNRVLEVDGTSRTALVEAGVFGPALEAALRPLGLTLRHFPQSFEFSTVGGWIATRAGGHYATGPTHIDDFVAGIRMLTPRGPLETQRVPYSGAGPSPERLILGSEGTLGVITRAWLRVQPVPRFRSSRMVDFVQTDDGVAAVRAISQSGLSPAGCRLISPLEAAMTGLADGRSCKLVLAFESHDHVVHEAMERALAICREWRGTWDDAAINSPVASSSPDEAATDRWRAWFLQAPYLRDRLVLMGLIVETFETATTWQNFSALNDAVVGAVNQTLKDLGDRGFVTWRLNYAYPDGTAPYYTVVARGHPGREIEDWTQIKRAASDAILATGGTITHHHAVGREHRPWYEKERGANWIAALSSVKRVLDPAWILNPDVLIPLPE